MPPGALPPTTVARKTTSRPANVGALKLVNLPPPGSLSPVPAIAMRQPPRAKNTPSRPVPVLACGDRATPQRPSVLRPEVPDQLRQAVERRSAIDPALAPAPAAADHGHVAQLGQARERIPEGDHRVALGLEHLAEEEAGLELALHALRERALQDRPLLLRGHGARRNQVGLAEVLEDAGGGADDGVVERGPVPHQRARLAVVREPAPDLGRQRLALGERKLPAVEVEPPADVRAQRAERHLGQERAREQRGDQEEVDRVVLVEVEVDALGGRHVQDAAARVPRPLDQPAQREQVEALLEARPIVALERGRDPRPLGVQQAGERVRRGEEVAHAARGARRAQERRGADRRGTRHRSIVHGAQQAEAQALDEAALLLLPLRVAEPGREALARGAEGGVQRDRVRIAHVDRPVAALEHAARAQERPERLALLLLAGDLALVGLLLRNAPVVDGDGHEVEVPPHALDEGVQDCRQHAELRGEDLPRPRPPALDEELLRVALADQEGEVLPEDHLVELVVLEGAAVEDGLQEAEVEAVEVGGHLVEVTARLLPHPAAREATLGRDAAHQAGQLGVAQHLPAYQPPRQERRAPHQALLAIEEDLQRARQPPHDALVALAAVVLHEAVEDDLAPEGELGLLGVPEVVEEALRLTWGLLHAVEEGGQARLLPPEALAAEDRDRDQEDRAAGRRRDAHHVAQVLRPEAGGGERAPGAGGPNPESGGEGKGGGLGGPP